MGIFSLGPPFTILIPLTIPAHHLKNKEPLIEHKDMGALRKFANIATMTPTVLLR